MPSPVSGMNSVQEAPDESETLLRGGRRDNRHVPAVHSSGGAVARFQDARYSADSGRQAESVGARASYRRRKARPVGHLARATEQPVSAEYCSRPQARRDSAM